MRRPHTLSKCKSPLHVIRMTQQEIQEILNKLLNISEIIELLQWMIGFHCT